MPALAAEPHLFPENLLDGLALEPSDRNWWVIYTRSRQEKALARHLTAHEIPFYLPLISKISVIRQRRVCAHVPMFANYLFMFGSPEERLCSLKANRISRTLPVHNPEQLCTDLFQLRRLIGAGAPLTVESRLVPGQAVRVRSGAFAGLEGTVIARRGETRLIVVVNYLQQGASVEIDDFLLEPLD